MLQRPCKVVLLSSQSLEKQIIRSCSHRIPPTTTKIPGVPIVHEVHDLIKWRKPDRIPFWDPRRSCDLKPIPPVDPDWLKLEYEPFADIINELPPEQRKIFTVDFCPRREGTKVIFDQTYKRVRRHNFDGKVEGERSHEHKVAWMTIKIRDIRFLMENNPIARTNGIFKKQCKELVEKRKKYLNQLRHTDYKRFEWLIEVLGIMFKPNGKFAVTYRKACVDKLTEMLCADMIEKKMQAYKEELEAQKIPFLEKKLQILQEIRGDEESMNLSSSVTDQISATIKQIEDLKRTHLELHPVNVQEVEEQNVVLS